MSKIIRTERLILRPWRPEDFKIFAQMNADPRVREYFPSLLSKEESDEMAMKFLTDIEERDWGLWAVSIIGGTDFIGFVGLNPVPFEAHFTPAVEIGWRLAVEFWGKGYATEGAYAALNYGFKELNLEEIISFTVPANQRSRHVMEKIKMTHNEKDNFEHPKLPAGHPMSLHVLYRMKREDWE